ncbi:M20 aminoacylase family protein [Cupriavidus consociatus]|uniref:M20 aminoacylase family protein n=1 Tax=Cupriavidus consociatus TaxID=2821357 RepID=UPI001AE2D821|nr:MULTISPECIES: M20 aminoacylase family protein [unclassified Cupriavidus]MBP0623018.1 amidohydrolase [Cupriavidus sp. LEh25]MDK2659706.1 M20 aminoacylase family protein [Cupriavidus sp. LEh21]
MTRAPTLQPFQYLPHLLPAIGIDAETFVGIRRQIHAQPELGFEVGATSRLVATLLAEWGYEVHTGIGKSGVVGQLKRGSGSRRLGIRADMDALPITEATGLPYASRVAGKMHACGHDGHTAILLAAARAIADKPDFDGTLNLIFQPDEENLCGARAMIEDGLFERFPCDAIFALHNMPGVAAGSFRVLPGPVSLSSDVADVTVRGVGGHGAMPHRARDPIAAAAAIVTALQTVVARNVAPDDTAVVSVGFIRGGATHNVIPEAVTLGLNVRAARPETRALVEQRIREIVALTAQAHGVEAEIDYRQLTPPMVNAEAETLLAQRVCTELVGADNVVTQAPKGLNGSEDFAWMLNAVPGCYLILGNGEGEFGGCMVHNPGYDFNDAVLPLGAAAWVRLVQSYLAAA